MKHICIQPARAAVRVRALAVTRVRPEKSNQRFLMMSSNGNVKIVASRFRPT